MLIKILGNIMVLASSAAIGIYFSLKDSFHAADLAQLRRALGILKSEIEYSRTPLPEAFINISGRLGSPFSEIFLEISNALTENECAGISHVWNNAFNKGKSNTYLSQEDMENVYSFGKTLGYLDRTMQLNSITLLENYIDSKMDDLDKESAKNKKMYGSLGILSGILICVILY